MNRIIYLLVAGLLTSSLVVPAVSAAGTKNVEDDTLTALVLGTNAAAGAAECEFDNVLDWTRCVVRETLGSSGNLADGTCEFLAGKKCGNLVTISRPPPVIRSPDVHPYQNANVAAAGAADCEFDNVLQWTNCVTSDTVGSLGNLGDGTCQFFLGTTCSGYVNAFCDFLMGRPCLSAAAEVTFA